MTCILFCIIFQWFQSAKKGNRLNKSDLVSQLSFTTFSIVCNSWSPHRYWEVITGTPFGFRAGRPAKAKTWGGVRCGKSVRRLQLVRLCDSVLHQWNDAQPRAEIHIIQIQIRVRACWPARSRGTEETRYPCKHLLFNRDVECYTILARKSPTFSYNLTCGATPVVDRFRTSIMQVELSTRGIPADVISL